MAHDHEIDGHILNLVQSHQIHEQSDLQALLKARGFDIPQATLSRKLKKLKIAKVEGIYKIIHFNLPNLPLVLNLEISDLGLIVLHVYPGQASSLASFLDQKYVTVSPQHPKDSGILGTLAGDDTILLVIKGKSVLKKVLSALHEDFPYLGFLNQFSES